MFLSRMKIPWKLRCESNVGMAIINHPPNHHFHRWYSNHQFDWWFMTLLYYTHITNGNYGMSMCTTADFHQNQLGMEMAIPPAEIEELLRKRERGIPGDKFLAPASCCNSSSQKKTGVVWTYVCYSFHGILLGKIASCCLGWWFLQVQISTSSHICQPEDLQPAHSATENDTLWFHQTWLAGTWTIYQ